MSTVANPLRPAPKAHRARRARTRIPNRQLDLPTSFGYQTVSIATHAARLLDRSTGQWAPELPTVFPIAEDDPFVLLPIDPFATTLRLLFAGAFGTQILELSVRDLTKSLWRPILGEQCPATIRHLRLELDGSVSSSGFRFDPIEETWTQASYPDRLPASYPDRLPASGSQICRCPQTVQLGDRFEIATPEPKAIQTVALASRSLFIGLLFEEAKPGILTARVPTTIPPDDYAVVLINLQGEPSQPHPAQVIPGASGGHARRAKVVVSESAGDLDTGIDLEPGDELEIHAVGAIPSGRVGVADASPEGWKCLLDKTAACLWNEEVDVTAQSACDDREFPLMRGVRSRPYALLAKLGENGAYFAPGPGAANVHRGLSRKRLYLRINTDRQNGTGSFTASVTVHSRRVRQDLVWIESVCTSPSGTRIRLRTNVRDAISLDRWYLADAAGTRTPVPPGTRVGDHPDGTEIHLPPPPATTGSTGRLTLCAPDGSNVSSYCY